MVDQPNISDIPRVAVYDPVAAAGPFPLGFPLFDLTGADLLVTLDGQEVAGWTLSGDPSAGFYGAPNTWINCGISFADQITGHLEIVGMRSPRRIAQFAEGRGIPARDQNTEWNILTAITREIFDRAGRIEASIAALKAQLAGYLATILAYVAQAQASAVAAAGWAAAAAASAVSAASDRASIQFILGMALDDGAWGETPGPSLDDGEFGS